MENLKSYHKDYRETRTVIERLKQNKSPGLDGLTCEFYQTFNDMLTPFLTEVFNESYERKL